jgi:hypothetical protein
MARSLRAMATAILLLSCIAAAQAADSPHVGQEKRVAKGQSEKEAGDYLGGRGTDLSKVAEMNGYPGPGHVLEETQKLGLSAKQLEKTQRVYDSMTHSASRIGKAILHKEAELASLFAEQKATPENTERLLKELANLQADLRMVHLNGHLSMRQILSKPQIEKYSQVRGFQNAKPQSTDNKTK